MIHQDPGTDTKPDCRGTGRPFREGRKLPDRLFALALVSGESQIDKSILFMAVRIGKKNSHVNEILAPVRNA